MKLSILKSFRSEFEGSAFEKSAAAIPVNSNLIDRIGKNLASAGRTALGAGALLGIIGTGSAIGAVALPKDV